MMIRARILGAFLIGFASAASAAPQSPFAAGPLESVLAAVRTAHSCGITEIRLSRWLDTDKSAAFFDQDVSRSAEMCLMHWMTKEGRRLKFEPRWAGDEFTEDWPS
jgi:hypothetical protein